MLWCEGDNDMEGAARVCINKALRLWLSVLFLMLTFSLPGKLLAPLISCPFLSLYPFFNFFGGLFRPDRSIVSSSTDLLAAPLALPT